MARIKGYTDGQETGDVLSSQVSLPSHSTNELLIRTYT